MGRDYWSRIWLAYGTYAYAVELFVAAQLYNDFFQGPLAALSIIHLRQATGTLDGGVACRVPCELWAMLREAVQDEARAMLRTAIHDLTVASTCDGCRPQLPSGAILRWADHPSDGGQSKFVWKGCSRCEEKARQMTGHIYRLDILPFLDRYDLTTEWYKYPESYTVEEYVPGSQTIEELAYTEEEFERNGQVADVRASMLLQPSNVNAIRGLDGHKMGAGYGYDQREITESQVLTRQDLREVLGDQRLVGLYRKFFADWPLADGEAVEPQLHLRCAASSG